MIFDSPLPTKSGEVADSNALCTSLDAPHPNVAEGSVRPLPSKAGGEVREKLRKRVTRQDQGLNGPALATDVEAIENFSRRAYSEVAYRQRLR